MKLGLPSLKMLFPKIQFTVFKSIGILPKIPYEKKFNIAQQQFTEATKTWTGWFRSLFVIDSQEYQLRDNFRHTITDENKRHRKENEPAVLLNVSFSSDAATSAGQKDPTQIPQQSPALSRLVISTSTNHPSKKRSSQIISKPTNSSSYPPSISEGKKEITDSNQAEKEDDTFCEKWKVFSDPEEYPLWLWLVKQMQETVTGPDKDNAIILQLEQDLQKRHFIYQQVEATHKGNPRLSNLWTTQYTYEEQSVWTSRNLTLLFVETLILFLNHVIRTMPDEEVRNCSYQDLEQKVRYLEASLFNSILSKVSNYWECASCVKYLPRISFLDLPTQYTRSFFVKGDTHYDRICSDNAADYQTFRNTLIRKADEKLQKKQLQIVVDPTENSLEKDTFSP